MDWRVTPPKRVTSPTCGPPPPCKQALSTQLKRGFNFPFKFIYRQPVTRSRTSDMYKSGDKKITAEKGNLLSYHRENVGSNFFKSIFIVKKVVLFISGINVQ